mmetsp:Transcript_18644/g.28091  ORF Transcript_18644/g.28091 Transcript_18644/m.28091 type:complete len:482 (-) Transcript_18644:420-1865(-)
MMLLLNMGVEGRSCWEEELNCFGKNMCECMGYPSGTKFLAETKIPSEENASPKLVELVKDGYQQGTCGYANAICDTKWAVICCDGEPLGDGFDEKNVNDFAISSSKQDERSLQTIVLFESASDFCSRNGYTSENFMAYRTAYPSSGSTGPTGYPSGSCGNVVADGEDLFAQCCCTDEAYCCPQGEDSDDCMATKGLEMFNGFGSYSYSYSFESDPVVGIPDTYCPHGGDDLDRSVCQENGEHDDDCCAMVDTMGCDPGYTVMTGAMCDEDGYYTTCCYAGCSDSTSWYKKGDTSKTCDWVAGKPDTRCNVKGEESIRASYACPGTCGTTCYDNPNWYKNGDPSKDCSWVHRFSQKRCFVKGYDGTLASYSCATTCGSDAHMDSFSWYKEGDPSKDCSWVSTFPEMRCNLKGNDDTTASYSCPSACGTDTSLTDSELWYKNGDSSKTCAWVSAYAEVRCDTVGWDNSLASESCPYACASISS